MASGPEPPIALYEERLAARATEVRRQTRLFNLLANARLFAFLVILVLLGFTLLRGWQPWWILAPAVVFVILLAWHARVAMRRRLAERGQAFYERGLARMRETWAGNG